MTATATATATAPVPAPAPVPKTKSRSHPRARLRRQRWKGLWRTAVVVVIGLLVNLPFLNAICTAFRQDGDIATSPFSFANGLTLSHFATVLSGSGYDFPRFLLNSAAIAFGTVVLVMLIAIPVSYSIVRLNFGGRWLLQSVTALRLIPAMFFAIPFFLIFSNAGLYDTVPALILANTFLNLPLAILIICGSINEVPIEIEEAATIDGAGVYRSLFSIVLPLLAPGLVAVAILVFLFSWSDYLFAVILSGSESTPVTVGAAFFVTSAGIAWGNVSAVVVVSVVIPLVFAIFAQKYLVRGLSAGALK